MAKVARTIAIVAGVVALSFAIPGVGTAIGSAIGVSISAATAATIASAAGAISALAGTAAQLLTKPPDMRGTVNEVMIGSNMPIPYAIGRTYVGGNRVYEDSANTNNYDRTQIFVYTHAGPIEEFEAIQADFTTIAFDGTTGGRIKGAAIGYYGNGATGYLWADSKLGERPDTALSNYPGRAAFRDWTASHKLSGMACASLTMEFDEDGKRWSSGIPQWGAIGKWVKVYDPRLDSTYPGGSGSHDWDDESTWEWSDNPGLHALAYARGRIMEGVKVVGVGLARDAIDVARFVELANLADANEWTCGGVLYEAPGVSKWDNLKQIMAAGAATPAWVGGLLTARLSAPVTALDTITTDDLADGPVEIRAMKSWRDRHNSIVPRYRSEAHKWDYVQAEAVTAGTYVTEDGEEKTDEIQFGLVQDVDQAAQLAAYELVNRREFGPINLNCKPRMMLYKPGDALEIDLPECGLDGQLAVITARTVDPATGNVQLVLESETTAKHAYALGQTGVAPPTPTIYAPEDIDEAVGAGNQAIFSIADVAPVVILADYLGSPLSGQLPRNIPVKLYQGTQDITASASWSLSTYSGSITATIGASDGIIEVTAMGSSGALVATAAYAGITKTKLITVALQYADTPIGAGGSSGTTVTDSTLGNTTGTSHVQITDDLVPTVGPLGEVVLSAPLTAYLDEVAPVANVQVWGIWKEYVGGVWTDVDVEVSSSPNPRVTYEPPYVASNGYITVSPATITGRTPGATPKFALFARNDAGTRVVYFSGTASALGR